MELRLGHVPMARAVTFALEDERTSPAATADGEAERAQLRRAQVSPLSCIQIPAKDATIRTPRNDPTLKRELSLRHRSIAR